MLAPRAVPSSAVLGPVVGTMGTLQATEAIKALLGVQTLVNKLLVYDTFDLPLFRTIVIPRRDECSLCGKNPTIRSLEDSKADVEGEEIAFAPPRFDDEGDCTADLDEQVPFVTCEALNAAIGVSTVLILDVRPSSQFSLCRLPGSVNLPSHTVTAKGVSDIVDKHPSRDVTVHVLCRRGVASKAVVKSVGGMVARKELEFPADRRVKFVDVRGGLNCWHDTVDKNFPVT